MMTSKKKNSIIRRMKDNYMMFRLCRLFSKKQNEWQRKELDFRIIFNYPKDTKWTNEGVTLEREVRITSGEAKEFSVYWLTNEYIKRYHLEHSKPSDAFDSLVDIDRTKLNANNLKAEIKKIIDNCLDDNHKFLKIGKENKLYLTTRGKKFGTIWGLLKAVGKELSEFILDWKAVVFLVLAVIGAFNNDWVWSNILRPIWEKLIS